jgi:hypothetical protein
MSTYIIIYTYGVLLRVTSAPTPMLPDVLKYCLNHPVSTNGRNHCGVGTLLASLYDTLRIRPSPYEVAVENTKNIYIYILLLLCCYIHLHPFLFIYINTCVHTSVHYFHYFQSFN